MLKNKKILVVGGDLRQRRLSELLSADNEVTTYGLGETEFAAENLGALASARFDYIALPIPSADENGLIPTPFGDGAVFTDDIFPLCTAQTTVIGGKLSQKTRRALDELKTPFSDLLDREEFSVLNAVLTAEGAIQVAMEELPRSLWGVSALVVGYGRIGKLVADRLSAFKADVTASARKFRDIALINAAGITPIYTDELISAIDKFHLIINTVPSLVLDNTLLSRLKKDTLIIDLASKPGGVDLESAKRLSVKVVWSLSLPGKVAPLTAGDIIFDTMNNIEKERRYSLE